jgi:hypothetical protein
MGRAVSPDNLQQQRWMEGRRRGWRNFFTAQDASVVHESNLKGFHEQRGAFEGTDRHRHLVVVAEYSSNAVRVHSQKPQLTTVPAQQR